MSGLCFVLSGGSLSSTGETDAAQCAQTAGAYWLDDAVTSLSLINIDTLAQVGITPEAVLYVWSWGFGAVIFMWSIGFGLGAALKSIRKV